MSIPPVYVTDTTVWEDYFITKDPNVRNWVDNVLANTEGNLVITPVVLFELIRRLYYYRGKTGEEIRLFVKRLTNVFRGISVPNLNKQSVGEIGRLIDALPVSPECHVGEISFLNLVNKPETVVVTSDGDVLTAYSFTNRLDPRQSPPKYLSIGKPN